jgi:hypothetical protein
MPPTSPEALARKRERARAWYREHPRESRRIVEVEGGDARWVVLTCSRCWRLFDAPRSRFRMRELCEDCRTK